MWVFDTICCAKVSGAPRRGQRTGRNLNRRRDKLNRLRGIAEPPPWVGFAVRGGRGAAGDGAERGGFCQARMTKAPGGGEPEPRRDGLPKLDFFH